MILDLSSTQDLNDDGLYRTALRKLNKSKCYQSSYRSPKNKHGVKFLELKPSNDRVCHKHPHDLSIIYRSWLSTQEPFIIETAVKSSACAIITFWTRFPFWSIWTVPTAFHNKTNRTQIKSLDKISTMKTPISFNLWLMKLT